MFDRHNVYNRSNLDLSLSLSTFIVFHRLLSQTNSSSSHEQFLENEVNSLQVVLEMRTEQIKNVEKVQLLQEEVSYVMITLFTFHCGIL